MQSATQPAASTTAPALPTLDPSFTFTFGGDATGVTLSPDGQSLLLVRTRHPVDAWDAATYWWPELSIILALLGLLIIGVRVSKRPNALGEPHCPRCGYMLRNLQEKRCPECGYERAVQRPRYGRRRGWRIAVLAIIAVGYAAVLRTGQMRTLRPIFFGWFDWPTDALTDRANTSMPWLRLCRVTCASLSRVTIDDGAEHVLNEWVVGVRDGPLLLAGGETCAIFSRDAVALIDLATGELLHTRRLDSKHGRFRSLQIRGLAVPRDGDRSPVWLVLNSGSVRTWNLETDETIELEMLASFDGRGFLEPLAGGGRVVLPNYLKHDPALLYFDEPRAALRTRLENWRGGWPTPSPDGKTLAWPTNAQGVASIDLVDSQSGALLRKIESPSRPDSLGRPLFTPDHRYLLVDSAGALADVLLADVATGTWIAVVSTRNVPHAMFTNAAVNAPSRIMRAGYTTTGFVVDVFDLDSVGAVDK